MVLFGGISLIAALQIGRSVPYSRHNSLAIAALPERSGQVGQAINQAAAQGGLQDKPQGHNLVMQCLGRRDFPRLMGAVVSGIGVFILFGRHTHDAVFLNFGRIDFGYGEVA